jgi:hypothetical protein
MSGVFERLQFNFTDANNIIRLSDDVIEYLNTTPQLLEPWQKADISNNDVGGYFRNPVWNVANSTIVVSQQLMTATFNINGTNSQTSTLINQIYAKANTIQKNNGSADLFIEHTNKISGITPLGSVEEDELYPYYITATSAGQGVMYLTNQTDGIQNNAPIMGSFTSLLIDANLSSLVITAQTYPQIINDSINITIGGVFPNTYSIFTSNLSESTLQTMYNTVNTIDSVMITRTNHDINFFRNANSILEEMDSLRIFTGTGETSNNLINNFVGSAKLLSRINT